VAEKDFQSRVVAVRMKPQIPLDRQCDDPLYPNATGIVAEHVELADAR
jgi:hypothetical protein